MCGICGIYNYSNQTISENILKRMNNILFHRGPDDEGYYINPEKNFGMAIRRLSIIDLKTGHQPIHNENKKIWVVFNGEIYNFLELKENLQKMGHQFYTKTDTEVLVHLYEEFQEKMLEHLRGMFAFAIWDQSQNKSFFARDRIGKKPLYYTLSNGNFIFASEIKSILEYSNLNLNISLEAIDLYLTYQYIPSPWTIYKEIFRLPPAHYLIVDKNGNLTIQRYWHLNYKDKLKISLEDAMGELKNLIEESVKIRLISDVPLGVFLSGGHDSTIVTAFMSEVSNKPVETFSIGFKEDEFSELNYARIVAKKFNTNHKEFIVDPKNVDILPKIVWHYDQPYADSSCLPSYFVSQVARKYVTVVLNGDGGDENFGGYLRYAGLNLTHRIGRFFRLTPSLWKTIASIIPEVESAKGKSKLRYLKRFFRGVSHSIEFRNLLWFVYFKDEDKQKIYSQTMKEIFYKNNSSNYMISIWRNANAENFLDRTFFTDFYSYLPECLMVKMDVASMANSLETRSPLLDHKLIEFSAKLPPNWKVRFKTTKYILKKTFKDLYPPEILHRPKQGFSIPIGKWFREDLRDYIKELLLDKKTLSRGLFTKEGMERILNEHFSGFYDHGYRLWALLMLELWFRVFIDKSVKIK